MNEGNGTVGFKPWEVQGLYENAATAGCDALGTICYQLQWYLDELSYCWASPEGVTYGNTTADALNKLVDKVLNDFINIINALRNAAEEWARTTQTDIVFPNRESTIRSGRKFIVSKIKDNVNGLVGVIPTAVNGAGIHFRESVNGNNNFDLEIFTEIITKCVFVGADQAANLEHSISLISSKLREAANQVSIDAYTKANEIAEKYSKNAEKISKTFALMKAGYDVTDIKF